MIDMFSEIRSSWGFKSLILHSAFSDIKTRYQKTILGPFWVTFGSLIFSIALGVVWSTIFKIEIKTYLPYLLSGFLIWSFISNTIIESTSSLISGEFHLKNTKITILFFTSTCILRNLIIFFHNLIAFFLIAVVMDVNINFSIFFFPIFLIIISLNLYWISIIVSIICLRYRDLQQLITLTLQVLILITPILWPIDVIPESKAIFFELNPLYHLVTLLRDTLLGNTYKLNSLLFCTILLPIGFIFAFLLLKAKKSRILFWY